LLYQIRGSLLFLGLWSAGAGRQVLESLPWTDGKGCGKVKATPPRVPNRLLRQAREQACFSQEALAERLGTTQVTISRWERGLTNPTFYYRKQLCELFGLLADALGLAASGQGARRLSGAESERPGAGAPEEQVVFPADQAVAYNPLTLAPFAPASGLVGRDEMITMLLRRLSGSPSPCSTYALYGLPGVGKTSVAVSLAHDARILGAFPDGVLWVGLGRSPNILGLLAGWGAKVGIPSTEMRQLHAPETWARAIRSAIGSRRMLLVVDDAWNISELLAFKVGGPDCCHLATTRRPDIAVQFAGRHVTAVPELGAEDGLALLARLAPEVVASEPNEALTVVQAVGGLPLALTILGGYLNLQGHAGQTRRVRAALSRLRSAEERLRLAEAIAPTEAPLSLPALSPDVSRSLQAAIAVSDERLDEQARQTLRALSIVPPKPNSFAEAAALAVGAVSPETLDALVDAGLLEPEGAERYTLHQTIADYASLGHTDSAPSERLAAYYVGFIEEHAADYSALDLDAANAQAALAAARDHALDALFIRGVIAFAPFLLARGLYTTAETYLQVAQEATFRCADESGLARIYLYQGRISELRGDLAGAESLYQEGLRVARRSEQRDTISALLTHHGEAALNRGDYVRAGQYLQEGLALAREQHNQDKQDKQDNGERVGALLRLLGEVADLAGEYARGETLYQEGLAVSRAAGDLVNVSAALQNLGAKRIYRGQYAEAEAYLREGLTVARHIQHKQRISALLNVLGALEHRRSRYPQAEAAFQESLALARDLGHRIRTINALDNLGSLATDRGDDQQATAYLSEALTLAREIGHPFLSSESLYLLGELHLGQLRLDEALTAFQEACDVVRAVNAPEMGSLALYGLARITAARGHVAEAVRMATESLRYLEAEDNEKTSEVAQWLAALQPHTQPYTQP
jgi:tetratricopeptide (TPR) repeat protein/transcriptional regulator with XRE-family HTH domain